MAAERQFNAIRSESDEIAGLAAYDDLHDVANLAVEWLEHNPCLDTSAGRRCTNGGANWILDAS